MLIYLLNLDRKSVIIQVKILQVNITIQIYYNDEE